MVWAGLGAGLGSQGGARTLVPLLDTDVNGDHAPSVDKSMLHTKNTHTHTTVNNNDLMCSQCCFCFYHFDASLVCVCVLLSVFVVSNQPRTQDLRKKEKQLDKNKNLKKNPP